MNTSIFPFVKARILAIGGSIDGLADKLGEFEYVVSRYGLPEETAPEGITAGEVVVGNGGSEVVAGHC